MTAPSVLGSLIEALPSLSAFHAPATPAYELLVEVARREVESRFASEEAAPRDFGPFGELVFPYYSMGAISSLDLFGLDELIIFSFYRANRGRYRRVADIGANIGLHSIVLDRCGYEVRSYEPDPMQTERMSRNLSLNGCSRVEVVTAAVSTEEGEREFVRVLGNLTGSHLAGAKAQPYGELERFRVKVVPVGPIMEWADLIKMDVEGHERDILLATTADQWLHTDALVEVGTPGNAEAIFEHVSQLGVNLFAQKMGWARVSRREDVPTSYRDSSLFISRKRSVPW